MEDLHESNAEAGWQEDTGTWQDDNDECQENNGDWQEDAEGWHDGDYEQQKGDPWQGDNYDLQDEAPWENTEHSPRTDETLVDGKLLSYAYLEAGLIEMVGALVAYFVVFFKNGFSPSDLRKAQQAGCKCQYLLREPHSIDASGL